MKAAEVMNKDPVIIRGSATVAEATECMKQRGVGALIVTRVHDEDAYGILSESDIVQKVVAFGKDPKQVRVCEVMTKPCIVVNPDLAVEYVARLFVYTGIRIAPIIKDGLLGTISETDILTKSNFIEQPQEVVLEQKIQETIANARAICDREDATAKDCAAVWHIVEELQAEAARQKAQKLEKTAFEEHREAYPEAWEARVYEAWCSG